MNQYPGHEHNGEVDIAFTFVDVSLETLNGLQADQKVVEQTDMASYDTDKGPIVLGSTITSSELPDSTGSRLRHAMNTPFAESDDPDDFDHHVYITVVSSEPITNPSGGTITVEKLFQLDLTALKSAFDTEIITDAYYYDEANQPIKSPRVSFADIELEEEVQKNLFALFKDEGKPTLDELVPLLQRIQTSSPSEWVGTSTILSQ